MTGIRSAAEFGAAVGTSKVTAWYWLTGRARPSLRFTLHICHRFGVSLADLLTQPERIRPEHDARQPEFYLPRLRKAAKRDWKKIENEILSHVRRPQPKAVALAQVARDLDIAVRTLRVHFPALCRKIGRRYRRRMRAEAAVRQKELVRKIRGAIEKLIAAGAPVKPQSIAASLGQPGLFGRHNARSALQQVIADA